MKNYESKRNYKKTILLMLLFLSLGTAVTIGAYWLGGLTNPTEKEGKVKIIIGQGKDAVSTTLKLSDALDSDKILVPINRKDDSLIPAGYTEDDIVEEITFTFDVTWEGETTLTSNGTLAVAVSDETPLHSLLNVDFTFDETIALNGASVTVTVTVTLDEPLGVDDYNLVAGEEFNFDVIFNVTIN